MVSITSDDILGKEAVDPDGKVLGIVMKLHIDKGDKRLLGITIDQGFMKPDIFVGINHVKHFGVDAVLLSRAPSDKLKGLEVITRDGTHFGTVKDVLMKGPKINTLVVSHGFSKELSIPTTSIKEIGARVVLKGQPKKSR